MADTAIPAIPSIPSLAALGQAVTGDFGGAASTLTSSSVSGLFSKYVNGGTLENLIFIILGLLLIAAGIFAFDKTQQVISTVGRTAAKAGEVAAA